MLISSTVTCMILYILSHDYILLNSKGLWASFYSYVLNMNNMLNHENTNILQCYKELMNQIFI